MPSLSDDATDSLWDRATAQRNVAIYVAILVAVPTGYWFHLGFTDAGGDFLLIMTLAVGVPSAYNDHWPPYDRTWKAAVWVLVGCAIATAVFTGLYLVGRSVLDPLLAAVLAFLVTFGGVRVVPYQWQRREGTGKTN